MKSAPGARSIRLFVMPKMTYKDDSRMTARKKIDPLPCSVANLLEELSYRIHSAWRFI
ncbi:MULTISPECIES: hypothetical protein [Halomonas]|uniref:hypothetical protein n=1 Tax=Halomonas TaxID=2745 RepID=UPI0028A0B6A4|nr:MULTISPECIES: hypothetical protein [Halomonas]